MTTLASETHTGEGGLAQRIRNHLAGKNFAPFEVRVPDAGVYRFGAGEPEFSIAVNDRHGLRALMRLDELRFSEAYINGDLDIEGDMWKVLSCRMEHLPDYGSVLRQFQRLLKPGGKIYLDASSFREKYSKPAFISRHVFPGNHRYFCLHEFLSLVARTNLEVQSVYNDYYSYYLTCREWAKNLESGRKEICTRWGDTLYRIFRLYLWGSAYAFYSRSMDAYRVVLKRPEAEA